MRWWEVARLGEYHSDDAYRLAILPIAIYIGSEAQEEGVRVLSRAKELSEKFNLPLRNGDLAVFDEAGNGRFSRMHDELDAVFASDNATLAVRLERQALDNDFREMQKDWQARTKRAFLFKSERKTGTKEVLRCIIARSLFCQGMALWLLSRAEQLDRSLAHNRIVAGTVVSTDADANRVADAVAGVYKLHVVLGRATRATDDYCHFLDLVYHLMGDGERELYGTRISADVYTFQLENAIDELLDSRSAGSDAAAFLIRSLLEVSVRRVVFRSDDDSGPLVVPKRSLDFGELVKACTAEGLEFTADQEVLLRIWDNLNLVVHLGFRVNTATLLHFFAVARHLRPVVESAKTQEEAQAIGVQLSRRVVERLKQAGLAEDYVELSETRPWLDIYYRY